MVPVKDTPYGPVTLVIPGGNVPRYGAFEMALAQIHVPDGSALGRARSGSVAKNRNATIRASDTPFYLFLDDDQDFDPRVLMALLERERPVVSALISAKMPPFFPLCVKGEALNPKTGSKHWNIYTWPELDGRTGLLDVHAVGTGCLLVTKAVLDAIGEPVFEIGRYNSEELNEDMYFSEKCRRAGIPLAVDLDVPVGHWDACGVWPMRLSDGTYSVRLTWDNGENILINRQDKPESTPPQRVVMGGGKR